MMVKYEFNEWQFSEFVHKKGHMIVSITNFIDDEDLDKTDLIFDTGAFVTVLSRPTARRIKLPLGTGKPAALQGFTDEHDPIPGELIEIPRIMLGKHLVYGVKVIVPLEDIAVAQVLGENVLEYFDYTVDHGNNIIYFKKNPNPKPYVNEKKGIDLSCGKVLLASSAM